MNAVLRRVSVLAALSLAAWTLSRSAPAPRSGALPVAAPGLHALVVGGGPDPADNQVAIESNVRYVCGLLPKSASLRVLFANGRRDSANVLYEDIHNHDRYRRPRLPALDGPSRLRSFSRTLQQSGTGSAGPLLLYFTGHGSPDRTGLFTDNRFDMWAGDELTVKRLASQLKALPASQPVTLIMVQCFSGAFGNLIFADGDPHGRPVGRDLCGFFASIPDLPAAGCTSAVDEANYRDFTGYFFAALSGRDRLGKPVRGADYDGDGHVGMDEAFAYTLIHDTSIDTPVCTSDVFLRRFVPTADRDIFQTPYAAVREWANPAQRAVLDGLSRQLQLTGDGRLARAYQKFLGLSGDEEETDEQAAADARWIRFVRESKSVILAHTLQRQGPAALQARFAALTAAEARNPLGPGGPEGI